MSEPYVITDTHGVLRVASTRVMLDSVVAAYLEGHSPETIQSQYPALTLEQVHGAIAYYLGHRAEVEEYLRRQDAMWEEHRERHERSVSPVVRRLRAARRQSVGQGA
jgi:uncharacterized protein (DUF433 family)